MSAAAAVRVALRFAPVRWRSASRPDRRRAARAGLGCGLIVVVAALVGMGAAVETVKPEWRDPEYGHRLKQLRALRAAHPGRPLVVAVGSSRTQMGFSPADMDFPDEAGSPLVYNFGQSGAGPLHLLLTVERLLDAGVKPDYLLVELFPAALAADGPAEVLLAPWRPRLTAADLRRLAPYTADPPALRREWAANRLASWHTLRLSLMSHWQPGWLPWQQRLSFQWDQLDAHGWTPYPIAAVADADRATGIERVRGQYAGQLAVYRVGGTSDRAVRDLLNRCRAAGVAVAFYTMPEGPAFQSWYTPAARAALAAYLDALTRECGVSVFDAAGGFGEDAFADGHHLLRGGAARFSRKLAAEYVRPWVGR